MAVASSTAVSIASGSAPAAVASTAVPTGSPKQIARTMVRCSTESRATRAVTRSAIAVGALRPAATRSGQPPLETESSAAPSLLPRCSTTQRGDAIGGEGPQVQRPEAADQGDVERGEGSADCHRALTGRHPQAELGPPLDEHEQAFQDDGVQPVEIVDEQGGRLPCGQLEQRLERCAVQGRLAAGVTGAAPTPPDAAVSPLVGVQVGQQRRPTGAGRPEDQQAGVVVQHVPSGS